MTTKSEIAEPRLAGTTSIMLALALLTAAVYSSVGSLDFVNYDDNDYVYANPLVSSGLSLRNVGTALVSGHAANWHPLTWISHMVDVELFGMNAGAHHLVNLALHVVTVLLLFLVLSALTAARWRSAVVAALFAVHPLNVESVAWIAERKNLLSTLAWLVAIAAYARWVRTRRLRDYLALVAAFVAGLLSKPMVVTLPLTLLVLDAWPLRRIDGATLFTPEGRRSAGALLFEKGPLLVLSAISAVVTYVVQDAARTVSSVGDVPMLERLLNAAVSFAWYPAKALVPSALCVIYPHPAIVGTGVSRPLALAAALAAALLVATAIRMRSTHPYLLAGIAWYAVTLLPVLGIVQVGVHSHADRYAYVPLIGIFVALVWLVADLALKARLVPVALAIAAAVVLSFAVVAHEQVSYWRTSETLFSRALKLTGETNTIARTNLASHYTQAGLARKGAGDLAGSLDFLVAAATVHPSAETLYNHAALLSDLGRYREAVPLYRRSIVLDAKRADAWLNLGDAQVITGDLRGAVVSYEQTLRLRRDKYADYGLAFAASKLGITSTADEAFARLSLEDPQLARELRNLLAR